MNFNSTTYSILRIWIEQSADLRHGTKPGVHKKVDRGQNPAEDGRSIQNSREESTSGR